MATEPTTETIDRARAGDAEAFGALFEAYSPDVLRVCRRMLGRTDAAGDACSDVFLKVQRSIAGYDPERPFRSWLLSIASHHCIDLLRRRAIERRIFAESALDPGDLEAAPEAHGSGASPLTRLVARERRQALDRALASLPLEYRLPLLMRYYADASYDEIAESLGTNRARVGTLIFRAKKKLRARLTDGDADADGGGDRS